MRNRVGDPIRGTCCDGFVLNLDHETSGVEEDPAARCRGTARPADVSIRPLTAAADRGIFDLGERKGLSVAHADGR
jgi:hypothetical protein